MQPTAGNNFLFAFDYQVPNGQRTPKNILYIHSTRVEQSRAALDRLMQLRPDAHFFVLKQSEVSFPNLDTKRVTTFEHAERFVPPDYPFPDGSDQPFGEDIDMVFFSANINLGWTGTLVEFREQYGNLLECINRLNLKDRTYVIDRGYRLFSLQQLDIDAWTREWQVKKRTLRLPWTLLSLAEKEELFELARSGPQKGAIVNIGHFLGGSSIILAKGSKEADREKIHSFDVKKHYLPENLPAHNNVDDWIHFTEKPSEQAAVGWSKRPDTRIRLLFVDGDHSYEGCKNDILSWMPFLVSGGLIAVHDYGNISEGAEFGEIVKAVHDTIIKSGNFYDFRRSDTLFIATKK